MPLEIDSNPPEPRSDLPGNAARDGAQKQALDQLFAGIYQELRGLAYAVKHNYANATLNPTALVDEAYLKLVNSPELASLPKLHFKRIAARAMRQILIEAARRRNAGKRGGVDYAFFVTLSDAPGDAIACDEQLLALHHTLEDLARLNSRQAAIVEYRFFGGLTEADIAVALGISEATVHRDWRLARAWLNLQLRPRA